MKGKRHMRETAIPLNTASATILLEETIAELDFIIVIMQNIRLNLKNLL